MSPMATGEQPLARRLLARLQPGDLLLADRNFLSHALLAGVLAAGVHVLWRAKRHAGPPGLEGLAGGALPSPTSHPPPPPPLPPPPPAPTALPPPTPPPPYSPL